jgi:hypothetical protein
MNWTDLLDPANGGPGEAPGYRETIESLRVDPPARRAKRKAAAKSKPAHFTSLKHGATDS